MKNLARAFVLSLVVTGAVASAKIANRGTDINVTPVRVSAMPVASCPPDDPNACGAARGR